MGGFAHNTGEGGLTKYHLQHGGDIIWQIGTGYFGARTLDGKFDPKLFQEKAYHENVKMTEIKLSQGAKPSHGGILPGEKVNEEIAEIKHYGEIYPNLERGVLLKTVMPAGWERAVASASSASFDHVEEISRPSVREPIKFSEN